jgi:hypothetical protein
MAKIWTRKRRAPFISHGGHSLCEFFSRHSSMMAVVDGEKQKPTLGFRVVPVEQSLKARIASKRVPDRIEFQKGNRDSTGRTQRVVEK